MKINTLLALTVSFVSTLSAAITITTPSGDNIPESLLSYLDCPIGDIICKNGKSSTCTAKSNVCQYSNPEILDELLSKNGHDVGNLTPDEYCKIHLDVCNMIMTYDPPLTKDYIYNLDQYLSCHKDDTICQYGKTSSCKTVLKLCMGNYPKNACRKLSNTCNMIYGDETSNTTTEKTTTKKSTKKTIKKTTKRKDTRRKITTK